MQFPKISLQDLAFVALIAKMVIVGSSFPEAIVVLGLLGMKAYDLWLAKKNSLVKTEDLEKKISSIEAKLLAMGLIKRSSNTNV